MPSVVFVLLLIAGAGAAVYFIRQSKTPAVSKTPTPVTGPKRHFLIGQGGDLDGQSWHIGSRRVTVGRAPSNYVQINKPEVSRMAAQLDVKDDVVLSGNLTGCNSIAEALAPPVPTLPEWVLVLMLTVLVCGGARRLG